MLTRTLTGKILTAGKKNPDKSAKILILEDNRNRYLMTHLDKYYPQPFSMRKRDLLYSIESGIWSVTDDPIDALIEVVSGS